MESKNIDEATAGGQPGRSTFMKSTMRRLVGLWATSSADAGHRTKRRWVPVSLVGVAALFMSVFMAASPAAVSSVAAPRLTSAEQRELQNLTPDQASRLNQALEKGFSKLGIEAGLGNGKPAAVGQATLTAYDWSGGISWDHAWVTASYANLAPYVDAVAGTASFATRYAYIYGVLFVGVCAAVGAVSGGVGAAICGIETAWIATAAANVHGTLIPQGNHGVWADYYWYPRFYTTGGHW